MNESVLSFLEWKYSSYIADNNNYSGHDERNQRRGYGECWREGSHTQSCISIVSIFDILFGGSSQAKALLGSWQNCQELSTSFSKDKAESPIEKVHKPEYTVKSWE